MLNHQKAKVCLSREMVGITTHLVMQQQNNRICAKSDASKVGPLLALWIEIWNADPSTEERADTHMYLMRRN